MALYSGKTGYIKIGEGGEAQLVGHMSSFSLEMSTEIIEVVAFGSTYKEKIPSIKDWSASADGNIDFEADSKQSDLFAAYEAGTKVTIGLGITEDIYFTGTAYIESLSVENGAEESPTISISFAGSNGVMLTKPTNAKEKAK